MSNADPRQSNLPETEQMPFVQALLLIILMLRAMIDDLNAEIKRLKKLNGKPKLKPSKMDSATNSGPESDTPDTSDGKKPKRNSGPKHSKKATLKIDQDVPIQPQDLPQDAKEQGWRFKGYNSYIVQDLIIKTHTTRYLLAVWHGPNGECLKGQLPTSVDGHYGAQLRSFILHQYHGQRVTQPRLLENLRELKIDISAGQLSNILTEQNDVFHDEKDSLLEAGLKVSNHIQTDDTGARHDGKNGYCTFIGNEFFSWFKSTESKSRINFLELLRAGRQDYVLNAGAFEYMEKHKLPQTKLKLLEEGRRFKDKAAWEAYLKEIGISGPTHIRIATEGALTGSLLAYGFPKKMGVVSDDAGQFNVFRHALCWIHAERNINKLVPLNNVHAKHIDWVRTQIWDLYADLKLYKTDKALQTPEFQAEIHARFDELCRTKTHYETLNGHLKRLANNKAELLRVLEDPSLPLHNNLSERDIREYVGRRNISGSTRSENGRRCRDTFTSLKKTCGKLGISFWDYIKDRVTKVNSIPLLAELVQTAAARSL
jgi:hypothetical protein